MIFEIKMTGSKLEANADNIILADGTAKKVKFRISADADWDGLAITAVFRLVNPVYTDARSVVIGDIAAAYDVPAEVLHDGYLYIGAIGVSDNGQVRLTTARMDVPIRVYQSEDDAAASSGIITPSVADQINSIIGSVSNLDTKEKGSIVAAINEVLGSIPKGYVKSVNNIQPSKNGDLLLRGAAIDTQSQWMDYQGSVDGAFEMIGEKLRRRLPYPVAADIGKVLTVCAAGEAAWETVVNAEEVAV